MPGDAESKDFVSVDLAENVGTIVNALGINDSSNGVVFRSTHVAVFVLSSEDKTFLGDVPKICFHHR
ncbi:hypothetical protein ACROYT_G037412 [Oculina patagonica]